MNEKDENLLRKYVAKYGITEILYCLGTLAWDCVDETKGAERDGWEAVGLALESAETVSKVDLQVPKDLEKNVIARYRALDPDFGKKGKRK